MVRKLVLALFVVLQIAVVAGARTASPTIIPTPCPASICPK